MLLKRFAGGKSFQRSFSPRCAPGAIPNPSTGDPQLATHPRLPPTQTSEAFAEENEEQRREPVLGHCTGTGDPQLATSQWWNSRMPVKHMVMLYLSAVSMTWSSRMEPPGSAMYCTPDLRARSTLSPKGKKASEPTVTPDI